jgi:Flp pilus assembly protein TadB
MLTLAILAAAAAGALAVTPVPPWPRAPSPPGRPTFASRLLDSEWWMSPWLAAGFGALAAAQFVGGVPGLLVGGAVAVGVRRWIATSEPGAERRRRAELERDLPLAVDLLVACVAAGQPPTSALSAIANALPGPLGERLRSTTARLALGADPETVWRDLAGDPALAPLGQTLARSARTGASISSALSRCADDLRRQRRARAETVARSVGVRAAAPLGACFLPAFLLIGVVPTVVGAFGALAA